ncbi:MAG: HPr family phosphocarrier protein [Acidimicrobiales bacterium]
MFAQAASESGHQVRLSKDGTTVNARSVLFVLTLDCHNGDQITIEVEGEDAGAVLASLVALVESGLGEHDPS